MMKPQDDSKRNLARPWQRVWILDKQRPTTTKTRGEGEGLGWRARRSAAAEGTAVHSPAQLCPGRPLTRGTASVRLPRPAPLAGSLARGPPPPRRRAAGSPRRRDKAGDRPTDALKTLSSDS